MLRLELHRISGVIGRRIKLQALLDSVPKLVSTLGPSAEDAHHAAVGITTTDLVSKSAAIEVSEPLLPLQIQPFQSKRMAIQAECCLTSHSNICTATAHSCDLVNNVCHFVSTWFCLWQLSQSTAQHAWVGVLAL